MNGRSIIVLYEPFLMVAIELFIRRATLTAHCTETNKVFSQREGRSGGNVVQFRY